MKKIELEKFGERLRLAFEGRNNTKISEILGVSPATVGNYIDGRIPNNETLDDIADFTKCSLHWLLTGEGEKRIEATLALTANLPEELRVALERYALKRKASVESVTAELLTSARSLAAEDATRSCPAGAELVSAMPPAPCACSGRAKFELEPQ